MISTIYYEDETVRFHYNIVNDNVFIHCDISKFTHSILKNHIKVFGKFLNEMQNKGYDVIYSLTTNNKYVELMGGEYITTLQADGNERSLYKWELIR